LLQFGFRKVFMELVPIAQSFQRRAISRQLALKFHESGWLTHVLYGSCDTKKSFPGEPDLAAPSLFRTHKRVVVILFRL
jgi:hypothetical protein